MNILGLNISLAKKSLSLDQLIHRLESIYQTFSGVQVTPETCMESPTVCAIVTAISRRISTLPVHVFLKTESKTGTTKERMPNHSVEKLLAKPNEWQTATSYWLDATSRLIRYGNYYAFKRRGITGPIRQLIPLDPAQTQPKQDENWDIVFETVLPGGKRQEYPPSLVHHARGAARDGVKGDSPIMDVREAIALEIAAEKFGGTFFAGGAMPGLVFEYMDAFLGHRTDEERNNFIRDFQDAYGKKGRFKAMILPKGMKVSSPIEVQNDKAQFLETRQYQRTVIAGAFGVPPHLVGDLSKGTFNNVEQQSLAFVQNCVLPYVRVFETAMERDLLTDEDRAGGVIIRFNLEGALRADFKTRQEGLKIQREMGVISPNEWREIEGMNPRDGGDEFFEQGPSGQSADPSGQGAVDPTPTVEDDDNES